MTYTIYKEKDDEAKTINIVIADSDKDCELEILADNLKEEETLLSARLFRAGYATMYKNYEVAIKIINQ